jgi:hypothetical protein
VPPGRLVTLFNKLTITYLNTWGGAMSEPGAVENIVDYASCNDTVAECPHINFVNLDSEHGRTTYGSNPVKTAAMDCYLEQDGNGHTPYELPKQKGTIKIGGETAEYYEQNVCPPYFPKQTAYFWYVKARGILVTASDVSGYKVAVPSLRAVLENAVWK